MVAPAIPANETERIADLLAMNILDTPPELRFDRIVSLARKIFDAPIGYIALVDSDRQWFKSRCGVTPQQTSRDGSFCGHTILQDGPLIIPDAREDPRFFDNSLVVGEPFIRFYAGFPLKGPGGHRVGTLCLADRRPRTFDPSQLEIFKHLAELAEQQLGMVDLIRVQKDLIETKGALVAAQSKLADELAEASEYVRSLLPPPSDSPVRARWRFISSSELGGDFFGYHWLDENRMVIYLLDVCGHGVGASLLSISVHNALRSESLPNTSFDEPAEVLQALNRAFPMAENNNKFFTIWYGIYDKREQELRYAAAGHPPAILLDGPATPAQELGSSNFMIGVAPNVQYATETYKIPPAGRLYVFSDGTFEVADQSGKMLNISDFVSLIRGTRPGPVERVDQIVERVQSVSGSRDFPDDFSLVELEFPG